MNQIQVTCDRNCIYCKDGFCECDQHLLEVAEEFLRLKRGEEVEHLKERESIGAASMEWCSEYEWDFFMSLQRLTYGRNSQKWNVIQNSA